MPQDMGWVSGRGEYTIETLFYITTPKHLCRSTGNITDLSQGLERTENLARHYPGIPGYPTPPYMIYREYEKPQKCHRCAGGPREGSTSRDSRGKSSRELADQVTTRLAQTTRHPRSGRKTRAGKAKPGGLAFYN
ncbi:hypothetical protein Ddc_13500 [Ditylenchus destructor]|nr:hypothetical protein Ddc_13500 [Ditylenchus destructor]